jgi:hypothetical protein
MKNLKIKCIENLQIQENFISLKKKNVSIFFQFLSFVSH